MSKQSDLVSVSQGASGDPLYIDTTNDRVGVGTSSPTSKLHVQNDGGGSGGYLKATDVTYGGDVRFGMADGINNSAIAGTWTNNSFLFYTNSTERMRIKDSGELLVGTTAWSSTSNGIQIGSNSNSRILITNSADYGLELYGAITNRVSFYTSAGGASRVGSITASTSSTSYNTSSDYRLKKDVQPMVGASDRLMTLKPVNFAWKVDGTRVDGFLAHEAQEVVPEAVTGSKDAMRDEEYEVTPAVCDDEGNLVSEAVMGTRSVPDYQGIDQSKLIPLLTAALQEALQKIDALEARVAALEAV